MQISKCYNQHFHFKRLKGMVPVDWDLQRPNMNAKALEIDFISQNKSHHVQANISFMYTLNYMQTQMIK